MIMKIYLLRHEKRYDSRHFDTSLTEAGLEDAKKLSEILSKLDIC